MKICHPKDAHYSWPPQHRVFYGREYFTWEVCFDDSAKYAIAGEDQWDWNKLLGVSYSINAMKESVMVGWRWDPKWKQIDLNFYAHIDEHRIMTDSIIHAQPKEHLLIELFVNYPKKEYLMCFENMESPNLAIHRQGFKHNKKLARHVNSWFGGQSSAPHEVRFDKKLLSQK